MLETTRLATELLTFERLPARIEDETALEQLLSRPTAALVDDLARLEGGLTRGLPAYEKPTRYEVRDGAF